MTSLRLDLADPSRTGALARILAGLARPQDVIALSGEMGAGKSTLARAFLREFADDPDLDVPSPTFLLVQPYETPRGLVTHVDLWRIGDGAEMEALGWEPAREGIVLVEWPERAGGLIGEDALAITLTVPGGDGGEPDGDGGGDEARVAELRGWPDRIETIAAMMERA